MSAQLLQVKMGLASEGDVRLAESLCSMLFPLISVKDEQLTCYITAGILKINFKKPCICS